MPYVEDVFKYLFGGRLPRIYNGQPTAGDESWQGQKKFYSWESSFRGDLKRRRGMSAIWLLSLAGQRLGSCSDLVSFVWITKPTISRNCLPIFPSASVQPINLARYDPACAAKASSKGTA
jgi:hypothetical protein